MISPAFGRLLQEQFSPDSLPVSWVSSQTHPQSVLFNLRLIWYLGGRLWDFWNRKISGCGLYQSIRLGGCIIHTYISHCNTVKCVYSTSYISKMVWTLEKIGWQSILKTTVTSLAWYSVPETPIWLHICLFPVRNAPRFFHTSCDAQLTHTSTSTLHSVARSSKSGL
jgi:hypothetical protein